MERYIRLKRHTIKTKQGKVTDGGYTIARLRTEEEIDGIEPDKRKTLVFDTSKARTMITAQIMTSVMTSFSHGENLIYCGEAPELDEGAIEDYLPELEEWLCQNLGYDKENAKQATAKVWLPFWIAVDEHVFHQFSTNIKPGKQVIRESTNWILNHINNEEEYDVIALTHGPTIAAVLYSLGVETKQQILQIDWTNISQVFNKQLNYLSDVYINLDYSNKESTKVIFDSQTYDVPIKVFEKLANSH